MKRGLDKAEPDSQKMGAYLQIGANAYERKKVVCVVALQVGNRFASGPSIAMEVLDSRSKNREH
jgi:hypothetical protein